MDKIEKKVKLSVPSERDGSPGRSQDKNSSISRSRKPQQPKVLTKRAAKEDTAEEVFARLKKQKEKATKAQKPAEPKGDDLDDVFSQLKHKKPKAKTPPAQPKKPVTKKLSDADDGLVGLAARK